MTIIKTKTGHIFVPLTLQNNPLNPDRDMLIIMRQMDKLDKYSLDREEHIDEDKLAKQFVNRSFQFMTSDASERRNLLQNELMSSYRGQGLMIIGGVQDPGKANNVHLLLYKTAQNSIGSNFDNASYDISVDVKPQATNDKDFEMALNQSQMETNSQLRAIITFEDTYSRNHFIIYQQTRNDRLYTTQVFPSKWFEDIALTKTSPPQQADPKKSSQSAATINAKVQMPSDISNQNQMFTEKLTTYLNCEERKQNNLTIECITNTKLENSYLVFSQ